MENNKLLTEIEQYLLRDGRIYFKGWEFNKVTLKQFYFDIYDLQKEYCTVAEIKNTYTETSTYKSRSFRDQFLLANYYFGCTLKEFVRVIKQLKPVGYYCGDIKLLILSPQKHHLGWELQDSTRELKELNGHTFEELLNAA